MKVDDEICHSDNTCLPEFEENMKKMCEGTKIKLSHRKIKNPI